MRHLHLPVQALVAEGTPKLLLLLEIVDQVLGRGHRVICHIVGPDGLHAEFVPFEGLVLD